jgi:hypothetical protein
MEFPNFTTEFDFQCCSVTAFFPIFVLQCLKRREEEILDQEQQNVTASGEHAACLERPTEAL